MLAATAFSLLIPAIEKGVVKGSALNLSGVNLIILAITIHNFPEGMVVGCFICRGDLTAVINWYNCCGEW